MNKKTTIGQRIFQVLIVVSFLITSSVIVSAFGTSSISEFIYFFIISFIPILIVSVMQYIAYGKLHPFYLFKN